MEFYLTENTSRTVEVNGRKFVFEEAEYFPPTGSYWGTLATDKPDEIEALNAAVKAGRIHRLTQAEYEVMEVKKNKGRVRPSLIELKPFHAPQNGEPKAAEPVATPEARPPVELESIDEALTARAATRGTRTKK